MTLQENIALFRTQAAALYRTINAIEENLGLDKSGHAQLAAVDIIKEEVSRYYGLPVTVMSSRVRTGAFVKPRHLALYLCRELTKLDNAQIAPTFRGDMNRGTVDHAMRAITNQIHTDKEFAEIVATLRARCAEKIENYEMPLFLK